MRFRRHLAVLSVAAALPSLALRAAAEEAPTAGDGVEPEYVRPLVPVGRGRNDSNPVWSTSGDTIAFERSRGDDKEIVVVRVNGEVVQTLHQQSPPAPGQSPFFFPGVVEPTSYNSGISWSPDGKRFVFMSNGGEGNYDLYLRESDGRITRITTDREKDGHADWSPTTDRIAFISGRSGKGDLYMLDLAAKTTTRLTHGEWPYLYPQWSPGATTTCARCGRPTASAWRSTPITTRRATPRPGP
jgi:Tol biopolymer transport system component